MTSTSHVHGLAAVAVLAVVSLVACGGDTAPAAAAAQATSVQEIEDAPAAGDANAPAVAAEVAAAAPLPIAARKPAPRLTAPPAVPVSVDELRDAYFHWQGEVVTFAGHPSTNMSQTFWSTISGLTAVPEQDAPQLVDCRFAATPEGKVARTETIVVRGRVDGRSWAVPSDAPPVISMSDCEVVSTGPPGRLAANAWELDGTPIAVGDLHAAVFGWQGKEVQASGHYHSSTYSSASDDTRHDLSAADGKAATCVQEGKVDAPRGAVDERDGVVVAGRIGEPFGKMLTLENCRFVNR